MSTEVFDIHTKPDTVFISYSWSSPEHKEWVIELARRLESDSVPVVLDDWETTEGQDLTMFMERMVTDTEIDKVLIICDKVYAEKANGRLGGVGTETTIASEEVYNKADQTKFIAIVAELDEDGHPHLPTYLKGKKYINMSSEQDYEDGYMRLLRNIFRKPDNPRPTRGSTPPAWLLLDEKKSNQASRLQLGVLKRVADSRPSKLDNTLPSFFSAFLKDYESYAKEFERGMEVDLVAYESFQEMIELRDMYVEALEVYISSVDELKVKNFTLFFENIYPLIWSRDASKDSFYEEQFDHMKLFVTELVIYTVAILLKFEQYKAIEQFIKYHYFVTSRTSGEVHGKLDIFHFIPSAISNYMQRQSSWISPIGELLFKRAPHPNYAASNIIQADLLIYMLMYFYDLLEDYNGWYPISYPYIRPDRIQFLRKLRQKSHFEEVKTLFGVKDSEEMKRKATEFIQFTNNNFRNNGRSGISGLNILEPDEIDKY